MSVLSILVDGRTVPVRPGDTVLAALINSNVRRTRCDRDGRPRFALCGMGVCQDCAVTIDGAPGRLACLVRCRAGMDVRTDDAEG